MITTIRQNLEKLLIIPLLENRCQGLNEIVIYGAGSNGRIVAREFARQGVAIRAFLDERAVQLGVVEGIPCHHPQSEEARHLAFDCMSAVIGVFNYAADPAPVWAVLRECGFESIISYFEAHEFLELPEHFWLGSRKWLKEQKEEILKGFDLLDDEISRQIYHDHIALRLTFQPDLLSDPDITGQYAPSDLPRNREPMRLIDGGAFDGDTLKYFLEGEYTLEAVAAFEPDTVNFHQLCATARHYLNQVKEMLLIPAGVGGGTGVCRFQSGQGAGSRVLDEGDMIIPIMALDDIMPNFNPTLIKLDIEGAEPDALKGAEKLISQYQPDLAVCVYHTPGHLWELPMLMNRLLPNHQLFLRVHRFNGFDTVAYAMKR